MKFIKKCFLIGLTTCLSISFLSPMSESLPSKEKVFVCNVNAKACRFIETLSTLKEMEDGGVIHKKNIKRDMCFLLAQAHNFLDCISKNKELLGKSEDIYFFYKRFYQKDNLERQIGENILDIKEILDVVLKDEKVERCIEIYVVNPYSQKENLDKINALINGIFKGFLIFITTKKINSKKEEPNCFYCGIAGAQKIKFVKFDIGFLAAYKELGYKILSKFCCCCPAKDD